MRSKGLDSDCASGDLVGAPSWAFCSSGRPGPGTTREAGCVMRNGGATANAEGQVRKVG